MSFWDGKICPVCGQEFNDNDDVVCCPDCGTAHHRSCWGRTNTCFFSGEHARGNFDTHNESVLPAEPVFHDTTDGFVVCSVCGTKNPAVFRVCAVCGSELAGAASAAGTKDSAEAYPPPPGGMGGETARSAEGEEDGVSRLELIRYCRNYDDDQITTLIASKKKRISFSVSGFFLSFFWLLYRKVTKWGYALAAAVMSPLIALEIAVRINSADAITAYNNAVAQTAEEMEAILNEFFNTVFVQNESAIYICTVLFFVLLLGAMLFVGLYGQRLYFDKAVSDIRAIKRAVPDFMQRDFYIAARGGVSILFPFSVFMLYSVLSTLIAILFI